MRKSSARQKFKQLSSDMQLQQEVQNQGLTSQLTFLL